MEQITNETLGYDRFECCYATVTGTCHSGAFLQLDNGEDAFAYKFASLLPGSEVLCTVLRQAIDGRKKLVSIDSVLHYATQCA